jgi:hypothetical protein
MAASVSIKTALAAVALLATAGFARNGPLLLASVQA